MCQKWLFTPCVPHPTSQRPHDSSFRPVSRLCADAQGGGCATSFSIRPFDTRLIGDAGVASVVRVVSSLSPPHISWYPVPQKHDAPPRNPTYPTRERKENDLKTNNNSFKIKGQTWSQHFCNENITNMIVRNATLSSTFSFFISIQCKTSFFGTKSRKYVQIDRRLSKCFFFCLQ
jgi:hypothetical protein